jgi:hypothetical protein
MTRRHGSRIPADNGTHFEIRPQRYLALDVHYHPCAYADLAGVHEKENRRGA